MNNQYKNPSRCCSGSCGVPCPPAPPTPCPPPRPPEMIGIIGPTGPAGPMGPAGPIGLMGPAGADIPSNSSIDVVITAFNQLLASLRQAGVIQS